LTAHITKLRQYGQVQLDPTMSGADQSGFTSDSLGYPGSVIGIVTPDLRFTWIRRESRSFSSKWPEKGHFYLGFLQHSIDFSQVSRAQPQLSSGFNL
jgi:hypothetical protein